MAKTLRLADRAAFLITGNGIQSLASMATVMVLTRLLTATQWGSYKQMWLAYNAAAPFLLLGIPASVLFFVPRLEAKDRSLFTTQSALLLAAIGTLAAFGLWAAAPTLAHNWHNPGALPLLRAFAPYPIFAFPLSQVANSLVAQNRHRTAALLTALFALTLAAAVVTTAAATRSRPAAAGLVPVAWAIVVASAIQLAMGLVALASRGGLSRPRLRLDLLGRQLAYSVPIGLSSLVGTVGRQVGQLLVSLKYNTAQFAIYTNGAIEVPVLGVMTTAVMSTLMPVLSGMAHRQETAAMMRLWHESIRKVSLVLFPLFALLFVLAEQAVVFLCSEKYLASVPIFRIYLLLLPLRTTVYSTVLMAAGETGVLILGSALFLVVITVLTWLLLGWFGMTGAAVAAVLATYALGAFLLGMIKRRMALDVRSLFPWRTVNLILLVACLCGAAVWPLTLLAWNRWAAAAAVVPAYSLLYMLVLWRTGLLTADDRSLLRRWASMRVLRGR